MPQLGNPAAPPSTSVTPAEVDGRSRPLGDGHALSPSLATSFAFVDTEGLTTPCPHAGPQALGYNPQERTCDTPVRQGSRRGPAIRRMRSDLSLTANESHPKGTPGANTTSYDYTANLTSFLPLQTAALHQNITRYRSYHISR